MINVWVASDLHEPAGLEFRRAGMEYPQHDAERREVEDRTERAEHEHEAPDESDVPA